jgi:subtilisin family serine protease
MKPETKVLLTLIGILLAGSHFVRASQQEQSKGTIVPGVGIGDYTLDMSKDDVLKKLGEPKSIFWGGEKYALDNLPRRYFMSYGDISFAISDDAVTGITSLSPSYKFANGLGVGDSVDKVKQVFGNNFQLREFEKIDILTYENKGISLEINKKDRTVLEINVYQTERNQSDSPKEYGRDDLKMDGRDDLNAYEDVSGKDLRASDLRSSEDILDTLEFNQETQWPPPERLPGGFDPRVLLQEGMNPGLGVRGLHAQGITGAGVHVGLIDQPLLLEHPEYVGKIKSYNVIDCGSNKSSMHGPAMTSQLVGKNCGTAPGAILHVVAVPSWKADAGYYARALDRFVTYNENAPKEQKIRVVSVSCQPSGEGSVFKNQPLWDEAVQRAQANGILVLDCTWHHGFVSLCWLDPQNRESVEACTPGFRLGEVEVDAGHIHVPSAPRTAAEADEDGSFGYAYDGGGRRSRRPRAKNGYSDTIPYAAGILALGWQIHPDLTPAKMKELLFASAYVHESGAKIIHPKEFIDLVQKQSENQQPEHSASKDVSTLVRQAAAQGRISFKLTTPEEFKEIAGQPNREWMEAEDELIYMEYSGVQVEFFGKPEINTPHTLTTLRCEGRRIDIGNNRPIVLRNEGDLDKFGSYWGYSSVDLSRLDLSKKGDLLKAMSFDSLTVWPESNRLPASFDPEAVMESGKNPGLGIRSLHKKGITGHGVSIAILDQPLLVDHQEYAERVHLYDEIHIQSGEGPASHGAAVVSIAIGKTVGVAPEAELYYIAQWNYDWEKKKFTPTLRYLVQGVHRILEVNKQLPKGNKIRVISISKGWEPSEDGYDDIMAACEEAKAEGIFVVSCSLERVYGFNFAGLGRNPLASPDLFESYEPGLFWAKGFYNGRTGFGSGFLLVPMDSRTTASPAGSDKYVLYRQGGLSWSVPYIAGVYALAVQVEPEITPERFWTLALKTGRTIELEHKGEKHSFGPIINPVALISTLQKE